MDLTFDRNKYPKEIREKIKDLPIFISGIDETDYGTEYTIDNIKDIEKVISWYKNIGVEILGIEHISPTIGPERDEIKALFPDDWKKVAAGGPWVDIIDGNGATIFSMFVKKAPWDYKFFTRK